MTTISQVVQAAIPSADHDMIDFILWNRTPYPMGVVSARSLYRAASSYARAVNRGLTLCEHCDKIARLNGFECDGCYEALTKAAAA